MVVPLTLLLQGEPTWDIVQLGCVRQVYEDLRANRSLEHAWFYIDQHKHVPTEVYLS